MAGLRKGSVAERLSTRFRRRRDRMLRAQIDTIAAGGSAVSILDMGGSVDYWARVGFDYLRDRRAHVTVVNLFRSELGEGDYPGDLFTLAVGDACALDQYADRSFDLSHSNSVIEHVRTWEAMKAFAAETRRIGRHYYLQTPNFWFPVDPHYYRFPLFHWLPRPLRAALFHRLRIAHSGRAETWDKAYDFIDEARLLDSRQLRVLFPDGKLHRERLAFLTKSLIVTRQVEVRPEEGGDGHER